MDEQPIILNPGHIKDADALLTDMRATADVLNEQWKAAIGWTFAAFAVCVVNGFMFRKNLRTMQRLPK